MSVSMSDRPSLRRFERRALIVTAIFVVAVTIAGVSGCFKRWPIVIKGSGHGGGEGRVVK